MPSPGRVQRIRVRLVDTGPEIRPESRKHYCSSNDLYMNCDCVYGLCVGKGLPSTPLSCRDISYRRLPGLVCQQRDFTEVLTAGQAKHLHWCICFGCPLRTFHLALYTSTPRLSQADTSRFIEGRRVGVT